MSLKWPFLLALLLIPLLVLLWRRFKKPSIKPVFISESLNIKNLPSFKKISGRTRIFKIVDRILIALLLIGLAVLASRPLIPSKSYNFEKSRDIVLLLDTSQSVEPMIPSMIDSMEKIIQENPSERFSIVTFGSLSNTVLPLTRDPVAIQDSIAILRQVYQDGNDTNYQFASLSGYGTDIGEGVLGAVNRFDNLETYKSRNIVLLSDLEQTGGEMDKNSEYYLEKVSLIPKYRINFYVLKIPSEFSFSTNSEIAEYGGAKVFEVDKTNSNESVKNLSNDIFNQILNSSTTVGKNLSDSPGFALLAVILTSIALILLRYVRWTKL